MPSCLIAQWCINEKTPLIAHCYICILKVHLARRNRNVQQWNMTNQDPLEGVLIVNKSHAVMTTSNWSIIWYQVYNDGECKQSSIIVVPHQYLQMISIVSLPSGIIQTILYSLSHLWTQQWKSIVFHKITKDVVRQPLKMNSINSCVSHYTGTRLVYFFVGMCQTFRRTKKKRLTSLQSVFSETWEIGTVWV